MENFRMNCHQQLFFKNLLHWSAIECKNLNVSQHCLWLIAELCSSLLTRVEEVRKTHFWDDNSCKLRAKHSSKKETKQGIFIFKSRVLTVDPILVKITPCAYPIFIERHACGIEDRHLLDGLFCDPDSIVSMSESEFSIME